MKKFLIIAAFAAFATGCASRGSVQALDERINELVVQQQVNEMTAKTALKEAKEAKENSEEALATARNTDAKLNRVFEKAQYK